VVVFPEPANRTAPQKGFLMTAWRSPRSHTCIGNALISAAVIFIIVLITAGCRHKSTGDHKNCMAVMFRGGMNSYFIEMEKGIRDAADEKGVKIVVLADEHPEGEKQEELLQRLVQLKVQALLVIPEAKSIAAKNLVPFIKKANSIRMPIILLHSGVDEGKMSEAGAHVECAVSCENRKGGFLAGEYLAKRLNGEGKILIVRASLDSFTGDKRSIGFQEALMHHGKIKLFEAPPAHHNRNESFRICRDIFMENKDVKGVFAMSDQMALGASDAVIFTKVTRPFIVGFDGSTEAIKAIKEGRIDATITQNPYEMGKIAVENALKLVNGGKIPELVFSTTQLITKERLDLPFEYKEKD
jgi:ABC-type sugar transport system substrate-binding protein